LRRKLAHRRAHVGKAGRIHVAGEGYAARGLQLLGAAYELPVIRPGLERDDVQALVLARGVQAAGVLLAVGVIAREGQDARRLRAAYQGEGPVPVRHGPVVVVAHAAYGRGENVVAEAAAEDLQRGVLAPALVHRVHVYLHAREELHAVRPGGAVPHRAEAGYLAPRSEERRVGTRRSR